MTSYAIQNTDPIKFCGSPSDATGNHRPGFDCNCSNLPLYISNIRNVHYQSILPIPRPLVINVQYSSTSQPTSKNGTAYMLQCHYCDYNTPEISTLKQHFDSKHSSGSKNLKPEYTKPYQCTTCGKSYEQPQYLNRHVKTDHREIFACDECAENFSSVQALITHTKAIHIEADLSCPICDRKLTSEAAVSEHLIHVQTPGNTTETRTAPGTRSGRERDGAQ